MYEVVFTEDALNVLAAIDDKRIQGEIYRKAKQLCENPEGQGKRLSFALKGFYSIRATAPRYRIIYHVCHGRVVVTVVLVGIRKDGDKRDVYKVAKRLADAGLLKSPPSAMLLTAGPVRRTLCCADAV